MASAPGVGVATDFGGFASLRAAARNNDPQALRSAARQFEVMFTQMLLKAARPSDSSGDLLGGSEADAYRDLYDQQMAQQLSTGHGLGIADLLVRQLQGRLDGSDSANLTAGSAKAAYAAATAGSPDSEAATGEPRNFVEMLKPHAEQAAQALGVPSGVVLAQAALETGWGRHGLRQADGRPSYNFFGIKADASWTGPTVTQTTTEYRDGQPHTETARFRAYGSAAEGVADYVQFLRGNPRYAAALAHGGDPEHFVQGLQKAGYATDPGYAAKIHQIVNGPTLRGALGPAVDRSV